MHNKKQVLTDHRRMGKKFIPPFIDRMGSRFQETSWIKLTIPELVWIALLNYRYGYQEGASLSLSLAKAVKEATAKTEWFAPMSSFSSLSTAEKDKVLEILEKEDKLNSLVVGLQPLNYFYPESSLGFINSKKIQGIKNKEIYLSQIKNVLANLYDKQSKEATFTQANALYISFALGKLQVSAKTPLANFPEIENYPYTEESKRIAASVRASINAFIGMDIGNNMTNWSNYFWNRGLEIDDCE
jgi:hypothetical protein